ncbi:MAG: hypothetical protein V7642_1246 [Burkholderiales bacterium]|jgi:hypothetical protein
MAFRLIKDKTPVAVQLGVKPGPRGVLDYRSPLQEGAATYIAAGSRVVPAQFETRVPPQTVLFLNERGPHSQRRGGIRYRKTLRDLYKTLVEHKTLVEFNADTLGALDKLIEQRVNEQVNAIFQKLARNAEQAASGVAIPAASVVPQPADAADVRSDMLTANQIGAALGVSDETVRLREQQGELFAVLQPGRKRGRQYPGFQLWPGVAGEPLKRVLARLGGRGASAYQFLTSRNMDLASLSPLQVLSGRGMTPSDQVDAQDLLALCDADRLAAVERAANAFAASLEA